MTNEQRTEIIEEVEEYMGCDSYLARKIIDITLNKVATLQESIFDKMRAEIEFEVDHRTNMLCAEDVFEIIDKYKVENKENLIKENIEIEK